LGAKGKYHIIDLKQVEKLGGLGLTDEEISWVLGVSVSTLNLYKQKHPEFSEAIKKGKIVADQKVVEGLYKRATGYDHKAVKIFQHGGEIIEQEYTEHRPPDPTACIFWLQNRRRQDWRDRRGEGAAGQGTVNIIIEKPE